MADEKAIGHFLMQTETLSQGISKMFMKAADCRCFQFLQGLHKLKRTGRQSIYQL